MRPAHALLLSSLLGLALAGCGGQNSNGIHAEYSLTPAKSTVAPGGATPLTAQVLESSYSSLEFSVVEGAQGGTVVANPEGGSTAVYTAPTAAGAYHVRVRFLGGPSDVLATRTSTVVVKAAE